jgi:uncharacterized protein (DUF1501 family)
MSPILSRREWLRLSALGALAPSMSGWLPELAHSAAAHPLRKRSCILLWMNGGPSQMDTFDLKPGHANGGPFKEIATSAPGVRISEHLPKLARHADRMAIIRSMSTREGDHTRGARLMHTGAPATTPVQYPTLGALVSKELGQDRSPLPSFVSISSFFSQAPATTPGFLGPRYAPLVLGSPAFGPTPAPVEARLRVPDLAAAPGVTAEQAGARRELLRQMQDEFRAGHSGPALGSRHAAYDRAVALMTSPAGKAFNLDEEPASLRDRYGRSFFGQGCLLARRLVERGVAFVEVALTEAPGSAIGWDTHAQNFAAVRGLSSVLDPAWATLMEDLKERGLLDTTTIVWMGEFGRTPRINGQQGRDHFPNAWSTVLADGGIKGGQVVGRTSRDGMTVEERKVSVPDFLATVCLALGINPGKENVSNLGRPIRIVDKSAAPIHEVLA